MLIEQFIKYLKYEKRFSKHTIRAYQNDLRQFYEYLEQSKRGDDILSQQDLDKQIRSWIVHLMEEEISERTINRKISTLKSFFKYLRRTGKIEQDPIAKIINPKVSKRLPTFVDEEHMEILENSNLFTNDFYGKRDRLIVEMLYQTGMRVSELVEIRNDDVDLTGKQLKVHGKRNKERIIPINEGLVDLIKEYKVLRDNQFRRFSEDHLLVTNKGKKLYAKSVYRVVRNYLAIVTTLEQKSPHVLRHSFATHMLNHGADLNAIKELLGHANLSATQIYTHNSFEKLKEIYKQAHPRN